MAIKLSVDTLVPLGVVVSLLGSTGYVGGALYKVDRAEKNIEQIQTDLSVVKENVAAISAKLEIILKKN